MRAATHAHSCCPALSSERRGRKHLTPALFRQPAEVPDYHHSRTSPFSLASTACIAAGRTRRGYVAAAAQDSGAAGATASKKQDSAGKPRSAKEAVERGLTAFGNGDSQAALDLFQAALSLRPSQVHVPY